MIKKDHRLKEILRELSAEFFSRTSNRTSMITVTNIEIVNKGGKAIILITVIPEEMEIQALEFANRQLSDFREYVKEKSRISRIPFFEVKIDIGEKNRQRIDEIERNIQ